MGNIIQSSWMKSTYRPKDAHFSVTDLCMPTCQLWAKAHTAFEEENTVKTVGFKSFLGASLHKAIESQDEDGVVKEFSWVRQLEDGTKIGGTADELRWRYSIKKWRLGDIKLKTDFSARKFLGIGTKSNPNPKPEQEKEQLQMSMYRWLFEGLFDIEDKGVIYLFTPGWVSYYPYPEMQEVWLDLLPISTIDTYIKGKLSVIKQDKQPPKDCPDWLCGYCQFNEVCKYYTTPQEKCFKEFGDER
ncbi:MAG: hypothetical protein IE909_11900 [Campylobacterales bacterium]|nr:hypothetical protein [Campylobacterales bacterium]